MHNMVDSLKDLPCRGLLSKQAESVSASAMANTGIKPKHVEHDAFLLNDSLYLLNMTRRLDIGSDIERHMTKVTRQTGKVARQNIAI